LTPPTGEANSNFSSSGSLEKYHRMKSQFGSTLIVLGLVALASIAPTFNPAISPECTYPIGTGGGEIAKISGRLFKIDGHVKYFAGNYLEEILSIEGSNSTKVPMHGGSHV
jgi:hypothetical protein